MSGPVVTLSGRVTKQHGKDFFKHGETRPSQTLLLKLDAPLCISPEELGFAQTLPGTVQRISRPRPFADGAASVVV
jgi:hypothetical protein